MCVCVCVCVCVSERLCVSVRMNACVSSWINGTTRFISADFRERERGGEGESGGLTLLF